MAADKKISMAVIRRLPRYYRYLGELLENKIDRISSKELSQKMNITASQIRQDLNNFGGFGQQGYGYNVSYLYDEIKKILGLDNQYNVIVIGSGNIGQALANYAGFEKRGYAIKAMFDISPNIIGKKVHGLEVLDVAKLEAYVKGNTIDIAILSLPRAVTNEMAKNLVSWGVKGFWNFSPMDLDMFSEDVSVENVHLSDSLMTLSYKLNEKKE